MEYPRFTVIIPQKNRAEYLYHTLRTCIIQDYPNFEIIVADDCSDDNSVEIVKELQKQNSHIKLIEHENHVGMRINFEEALAAVQPGYVIALGGDDGLVPGCIARMYEIIKETGTELLTWSQSRYAYPIKGHAATIFSVPRKTFNGVKMIKSSEFLNKIAKTLYYMVDDCPMFYVKGVASTKLVDRVKTRTPDGCFYYCPTPDGFSGVVLAGEVEEYAYTREPLTINGDTTKSQGRNYKRTDEKSKKESDQFFKDNAGITMHQDLASQPYSPLHTLMSADYLLTARDLPGWPGKFDMFTWKHLIVRTFKFLERAQFDNKVLIREMKILKEIAIQHEELELFNKLLKNSKRKLVKQGIVDGFLVTKNVFEFNASEIGINNIFDAALATPYTYSICNSVSCKFVSDWFKRTIRVLLNKYKYTKQQFPQID